MMLTCENYSLQSSEMAPNEEWEALTRTVLLDKLLAKNSTASSDENYNMTLIPTSAFSLSLLLKQK